MKVLFSWLKEYVEIDISAEALQEKLFSCGLEVEELIYLGENVEHVVTGRIVGCEKHPDADRLTVCTVDCGGYGIKQIVTAATNVFEGACVPCALDGAIVRDGEGSRKIKTGKLRGVLSEGMFCSGEELGIGDDFYEGAGINGILILDEGTAPGADIRPVVGIDDYIFDIAVTANRPDCQSVYGIAREVAACLKKPLKELECGYHVRRTDVKISVEVREPALCPRYLGHYLCDVKIAPSPRLMRRRLAALGLRSVNNIVDITNYVLLEVGQPMHAFDRRFLHGDQIIVRHAEEGETIVTLDEKEFTLRRDDLLICDGERPVALAGIMGGLNSEIGQDTAEVFFEAASFARACVRRTSRALGQRSDSSARFERGVDACYSPYAGMERALHLVEELGCGTVTDCKADVGSACADRSFSVSYRKLDKILGIHVPEEEVQGILTRLGFEPGDASKEQFTVHVPSWRTDIDLDADIAEEVIRMYGYGHLKPTFLENAAVTHGGLTPAQRAQRHFKEVVARVGYCEAYGFSFYSPKDFDLLRLPADAPERRSLKIANPIGEDLSVLRTILAPTMIANVVRNVRRGNETGRLFECAHVFLPREEGLPEERMHASFALWGAGDFFDLKGLFESIAEAFGIRFTFVRGEKSFLHPGVTANVLSDGREVGWLGELHPEICEELALEKKAVFGELDYDAICGQFRKTFAYHTVPAYPAAARDLAVVVGEQTTCAELTDCILRACKAVTKAELFDVYRDSRLGEGKKSMAVRITFAPGADKPLTPEATDAYFCKIVDRLHRDLGAELR